MKKLIVLFTLLFTTLTLSAIEPAIKYLIGGIRYVLDGDEAIVYPLSDDHTSNYEGDIIVPDSIEINGIYHYVTGVTKGSFSDCPELTSVSLPCSILWLQPGCFANSPKLSALFINNLLYTTEDSVIYSAPQDSVTTIDFTNTSHSYDYGDNAANLHFTQSSNLIALDVDETDGQGALYFSWDDSDGVLHKVLRIYRDSYFTISSQRGKIIKIEFFFDGRNDIETAEGSYEDGIWTGSSYSVKFLSNRRNNIDSIRVTTEEGVQLIAAPEANKIGIIKDVCAIQPYALTNNAATSVTIPASVDFLGENSLSIRGLISLIMKGVVPSYTENPFVSTDKTLCTLFVQPEYLDAYKQDSLFSRFKNIQLEQTTGISSIKPALQNLDAIYTLQGLRVLYPQIGSISIKNGKKFICR